MKIYQRHVLCLLFCAIYLTPYTSFGIEDDCAYANQYTELIKSQTQLAIKAPSLELSKFYAYKALKGMYQTRDNYKSCGCEDALSKIKEAEKNLRAATQTSTPEKSRELLKTSLKLTLQSLDDLNDFRTKKTKPYDDDVLVMNVQPAPKVTMAEKRLTHKPHLKTTIEHKVSDFKSSVANLKKSLSCDEVKEFVTRVQTTTKIKLNQKILTPGKKFYYNRMLEVTYDELADLESCISN